MKADEDVRVIFSEASVLFTKACEACDFFIPELTIRSWLHVEESKRQALQKTTLPPPLPAPTYSISWWILYPTTRSRRRQWRGEGSVSRARSDGPKSFKIPDVSTVPNRRLLAVLPLALPGGCCLPPAQKRIGRCEALASEILRWRTDGSANRKRGRWFLHQEEEVAENEWQPHIWV
ncbi:unnamed protein product [Malus baccata var. baccata]